MLVNNELDKLKAVFVQFATDESADTSSGIDLKNYHSGLLVIGGEFVHADTETLSFRVEVADSADNSSYSSYSDLLATTVVKTGSGSATATGVTYVSFNPASYDRYVKFRVTATTSIGTGNVDYTTVCLLGDASSNPQTQATAW